MRLTERSDERTMYAMKAIISLPEETRHTDKMYDIKSIHGERGRGDRTRTGFKIVTDVTEQVIDFLKNPLPDYALLEARQEKILTQLAELKKQVSTLCDFLKHTNHEKTMVHTEKKSRTISNAHHKSKAITVDLIINVNPNKPPYSITALQKVWNDTNIKLQSYVHSSITGNVPEIYICDPDPSKSNVINLSCIWKEVGDLELVVSGLYNYSLFGEVNFLRYLSRILYMHSFESHASSEEMVIFDSVFDYCHCLQIEKSSKKQVMILQLITDKLGKNKWFGKNEPNIVDVAVWSVIKQISIQNLPTNLTRWNNICEKVFK